VTAVHQMASWRASSSASQAGTTGAVRMMRSLFFFLVLALLQSWAAAQDFEFHAPPSAGDPTTSAVMRDLAERILPVYQEDNPERYLANLSTLQLAAGNYTAAHASRQSLRDNALSLPGLH